MAGNYVIVLVNFFNDEQVVSFIQNQLFAQENFNWNICLVNNGSVDSKELKTFCQAHDNIYFIDDKKNYGYFGAAARAYDYLLDDLKSPIPQFFILSNTDISFQSATFLRQLETDYINTPVGMIGPRITSARFGHEQNPYYISRISSEKLKRIIFFTSAYWLYVAYQMLANTKASLSGKMNLKVVTEKQNVYAIHGSMMIFTHTFFSVAGNFFKDAPFLFGEEIFAAEICRRNNLQAIFDSNLFIYHNEHTTTKLFKSKITLRYMHQSIKDIYKKFFS